MRDTVRENLEDAQSTQKKWYDHHARNREFEPGNQVLVLLPTSTNKLLASWCGPYSVTRRVSPVNYEVEMADRRRKRGSSTSICYSSGIPHPRFLSSQKKSLYPRTRPLLSAAIYPQVKGSRWKIYYINSEMCYEISPEKRC